ncbi:MAG: bifunctional 23S rRNA (guanine(2069)-N(7))-methyltransferase RlmK/23S rRNA (guanine(2445)-N(2))-methyltransferase RlmL [Sandaracinus sp.]|nr:bifunctional 23S rRNA (guanine(2069)-N(7))-methyltransferase RlmK/23S rRNA (guanine(2445)-N(2))-methyltransferase RlmL [Sandaracinus sp.]
MTSSRLRITCAAGTEGVLDDELRDLGLAIVDAPKGARIAHGGVAELYRVALHSRVASRVVMLLDRQEGVEDPDGLYDVVRRVAWESHLPADATFLVDLATQGAPREQHHGRYLTQRAKDAVVDRLRAKTGARPDVDRNAPDLRVHVRWGGSQVLVGVDPFGPLHFRGYRPRGAPAPLRENLAAALLKLAAWDPETPLIDPMCGSGTWLVEAAWIARDVAPGLGRRLGAWAGHDRGTWARLHREADERRRASSSTPVRILGCDVDLGALAMARESLATAQVEGVTLRRQDVRDLAPPEGWENGHLVVNPPYGERLGADASHGVGADDAELQMLHARLGDAFKQRFGGWTAHVLQASPRLLQQVGLKPKARHVVFNGPLECRFADFPLRAATSEGGPSWRKPSAESESFANRFKKNLKKQRAWAKGAGVSCFRLYDGDIPEYNVAVDLYATNEGEHAVVQEYQRPRKVDPGAAERRLRDVVLLMPELLGVDPEAVHVRTRQRQRGSQYEKRGDGRRLEVEEGGLRFLVDLDGYLDTGLFLDHRLVRAEVAEKARGKRFLNLFAYTCSASVHAAAAGATTTSVDLSQTYLDWGADVFVRNRLDLRNHRFLRADVERFLSRERGEYDVVFLNPPSYSRSKAMEGDFSLERDHVDLLDFCLGLVAPGGSLYFTTHARGFELDPRAAEYATEVSDRLVPPDFTRSPFRGWLFER